MEFRLGDAQLDLQQTVARFFEARVPLDAVTAREGAAVDRGLWREMADLGLHGLLLDEASGGSGAGVVEAAIVFEQVGSHLVSGPLLWSVLAAPLVDGVAAGERIVGGVEAGAIEADGSAIVEHAADLDVLLVLRADSVTAHPRSGLPSPQPLTSLDPLATVGRVTDLRDGELVGDAGDAARLRLLGAALTAATLAGVASRALEVARTYALERQQFGVPIGSFQAVKHLLADMYVRTTLAQSATYAAAAVVDQPGADDPVRAAAGAKLLAAEAAVEGASTAIQVLGGMGFTWDMLPNHLLKRAWSLEHAFGTADDHALDLGSALVAAVS